MAAASNTSTIAVGDQPEPAPQMIARCDMRLDSARAFNFPVIAILLLAYAAVLCGRMPAIWPQGRFYAEEGSNFFAYAWHMPWHAALFHTLGGYLNIVASGGTLLAVLLVKHAGMPLADAPYITIAIALVFQLMPATLLLTMQARWLDSRLAVVGALIMLIPPCSEELWLHTLHSQFHLAVCVVLIMLSEPAATRTGRTLRNILLLLAPLSGPLAIALVPVFALRSWLDDSPFRWKEAAMLALGAAIQLLVFYHPEQGRGYHPGLPILSASLFVRHLVLPFAGIGIAERVGGWTLADIAQGRTPWWATAGGAVTFAAILQVCVRNWRQPQAWLFATGILCALIGYDFGMLAVSNLFDVTSIQRYAYAPQVLVGLAMIAGSRTSHGFGAAAFTGMAGVIALINAGSYFQTADGLSHGPPWRTEVAAWHADPHHKLALWSTSWAMDLSPDAPPCTEKWVSPAAVPTYCDAYWRESVRIWMRQFELHGSTVS